MRRFALALIFLASLAWGCAPINVATDFDHENDFSLYRTFCWLQGCEWVYEGPTHLYDTASIGILKRSIVEELEAKGYAQDQNDPDFLVDFHIIIEEEDTTLGQYSFSEDVYPTSWYPFSDQTTYRYLKGSLLIDMVDARSSQMVWISNTQRYMELDPEISLPKIKKAIKRALKEFPTRAEGRW